MNENSLRSDILLNIVRNVLQFTKKGVIERNNGGCMPYLWAS
jgi:hypothetical protein